jgi:hypothetical protein
VCNKYSDKEVEMLEGRIKELESKIVELDKRLRIYESPHVPSSKRIIKIVEPAKEPKKKGAPIGHTGTTRETPAPDKTVKLNPDFCPKCNGTNIGIVKRRKKTVEDIEIIKHITEYHFFECRCNDCNAYFATTCPELPAEGRFGPNISSLWSMLHYEGIIPFDRLSQVSKNGFNTIVSPAGIHNAIYRNTKPFKQEFEEIYERVSNSKSARSDETSYSFNGKPYWLWNISACDDTLVLIRNSRGSKVLKEVFGEFFDGVLLSDCFSAYGKFDAREYQKCWAHVLRDAKDLAMHNSEGAKLYKILCRMYDYIKNAKANNLENTPKVRQWIRNAMQRIGLLSDTPYGSKAVMNLVLRMQKHKDDWFTCLKYEDVEPTNNSSERDIRKNVLARKVSGLHRSSLGLRSREIMMSVLLTAKKKGQNPYAHVLNGIKNYNSGTKRS